MAVGSYGVYCRYVTLRQANLIRQARHFAASDDQKKAMLCVERALRYNPRDLVALRLLSQIQESSRSPAALISRRRIVELAPRSLPDRLALAETALAMRDLVAASNALEGVTSADRDSVAYQNLAGALAASAKQLESAQSHFLEALRLDSANASLQMSLAVVRLHGTNVAASEAARHTLEELAQNPTNSAMRSQALRELTVDAIHHHAGKLAVQLSTRLIQEPGSVFADRLLRLEALRDTEPAALAAELPTVEREAGTNYSKIEALAMWREGKTPPKDVLAWLRTFAPNVRTNPPVAPLIAECCITLQDWAGLQDCVQSGDWGELDFIRHAFAARADRALGLVESGKAEWDEAVKIAGAQDGRLATLLHLTTQWKWITESEDLLWAMVELHPREALARETLAQLFFAEGNTRSLMKLYRRALGNAPFDPAAKSGLVLTALLLDAKELKPHEMAEELYKASPTNSNFVTIYALSLFLRSKPSDALSVIEHLDAVKLDDPSVAGFYGIILQANGQRGKAAKYLNAALKIPMLPEERKLVEQAISGV